MTDIPSWAVRGAKVVCITQAESPLTLRHNYPQKGGVYTIRAVVVCSTDLHPALLLDEVVNHTWDRRISQLEPGFGIEHFRPVQTVTLSSDIAEHFEHLLDVPASHEREAEAA